MLGDGVYTTGSGNELMEINKDITIRAQNSGQAVLDGQDARRVVHINGGTVHIEGLNITNGDSDFVHTGVWNDPGTFFRRAPAEETSKN